MTEKTASQISRSIIELGTSLKNDTNTVSIYLFKDQKNWITKLVRSITASFLSAKKGIDHSFLIVILLIQVNI